MKLRTTVTEKDLDMLYDVLIVTVVAMTVIALIAKIGGVI